MDFEEVENYLRKQIIKYNIMKKLKLKLKEDKPICLNNAINKDGLVDFKEFMVSSLLKHSVTIDRVLTLGNLMDILYDIKKTIDPHYFQNYKNIRNLINNLYIQDFRRIIFYKSIEITDDGHLKTNIKVNLLGNKDLNITNKICDLKIILDTDVVDSDNILKKKIKLKADFTLLEIAEALCEDFFVYLFSNL
jgi:hypothetical protein